MSALPQPAPVGRPFAATMRCRKCGESVDVDFSYASAPANGITPALTPHDERLVVALQDCIDQIERDRAQVRDVLTARTRAELEEKANAFLAPLAKLDAHKALINEVGGGQ